MKKLLCVPALACVLVLSGCTGQTEYDKYVVSIPPLTQQVSYSVGSSYYVVTGCIPGTSTRVTYAPDYQAVGLSTLIDPTCEGS